MTYSKQRKKFGIFIGRLQPIHKGHIENIYQIIKEKIEPIIFIGSTNIIDDKNPLNFTQRKKLVKIIFPDIKYILSLEDNLDWNKWFKNLENKLKNIAFEYKQPFYKEDFVFYIHKKEKDKCKFLFKKKEYYCNYQEIFDLEGYPIKELKDICIDNNLIHSTEIRKNKKYAKKVVPSIILKKLEEWHFWGKELYNEKYNNKEYKIIEYPNFIKVYGGDGTMLKAVDNFKHLNKPFYGIAQGTVNFLMNTEKEIKKPTAIELDLIQAENKEAFNEIIIGNEISDWIDFNIEDKDEIIGNFKGGGIIISTAQGSTGVNKSTGGVILPLSSKNWVISGILTNRRIHYVLEPQKLKIKFKSRKTEYLWIDGKKIKKFLPNIEHEIIIQTGKKVVLFFNNIHEFKKKRKM